MTPDELLRSEVAKWLQQAAKDRHAAQVLLEPEPSRSVFHSQQAAEKAVKAFLTYRQTPFRKAHDLKELSAQSTSADPSLEPVLGEAVGLTDYAFAFRYPDAEYEPDADEAAKALAIAVKVCDEIRRRVEG